MDRRISWSIAIVLTGMCGACRTLGPPPPELEQALATHSGVESRFESWEAEITIDSDRLGGTFQAAVIADIGGAPRVRLQLLPDIGGKVLDLVATPTSVRGYLPHAAIGIDANTGGQAALPRHFLVLFAATLLERAAPLDFARVRAARREEHGGWTLEVDGALGGVRVRVELSQDGEVVARDYRFRGVRWTERLLPEHRIDADSFHLSISNERVEAVAIEGDALFELVLPAGLSL